MANSDTRFIYTNDDGSISIVVPADNTDLTLDQIKTLEAGDNIATMKNKTLKDLGIDPQGLRKIIPNYLWRFRKGGQFAK